MGILKCDESFKNCETFHLVKWLRFYCLGRALYLCFFGLVTHYCESNTEVKSHPVESSVAGSVGGIIHYAVTK